MFKVLPLRMDTGTKSQAPLVDSVVNNALRQIVLHMNQPLPQIVDVLHFRPVNAVLHRTPYLVIHQN